MFISGVIAIFNAFGFQCVGFLRLGDGRILFYMRLHELGHDRHFILFLLHFGIKCCSVTERLPDKLTVSKHCGAIAHQVIVGDKETLFDLVLGECRSLASVLIFELLIALKYHASIFIRGMPDLSAVETATVSTDDFTVKSLITVCSAQFLVHTINWHIQYNRNNQTYRMLISICWLLAKGLLQTNSDGSTRLMDFLDEQRMCRLYEKFILEYYKREFPMLDVSASQIPWALDDGIGDMLPAMQSDITLSNGNDVLIIDAKYYPASGNTQVQYDKHTLHSGNLYQIFSYVKNKDAEFGETPHKVSGMLLYAKTEEDIQPDNSYRMSGNEISVKTLDLNMEFAAIAEQLNTIVKERFGLVAT